ncbi:MAG: ATP-binding protein [Chloroflexi bacterium]|nr:ATP-binding protein [Chloroflexota bacterium]MDA1297224.1 ATP-binding protein [Chloroflexota bacterium]
MTDISKYRVPAEKTRWTIDPATLPFSCTDEIKPPGNFIGQERAVRAIEFGLGMDAPGYNIFVSGLSGTGKSSVIRSHLEQAVKRRSSENGSQLFHDWVYFHNFERPDQPAAAQLPQGMGAELANTTDELLQVVLKDLPAALSDDTYAERVRELNERTANSRREVISEVERSAEQRGFTVQAGPAGIVVVPKLDGQPMTQEAYLALSDEQRQKLEEVRSEITRQVERTMDQIRRTDREAMGQLVEFQRTATESAIGPAFDAAINRFKEAGADEAAEFLAGLRAYSHDNAIHIISGRAGNDDGGSGPNLIADPRLPFRVNVFVDNSGRTSPPIIMEDNPTYSHLFGHIDRRPIMGTYITDHTMLRPGSLAQANGGYLVIDARLALSHAAVWPALKRVLKGGEVRPEDPEDLIPGFIPPQPLRPEPIPIHVKVVLTGEPEIYQLLAAYDPDFWEIVKVRADLNHQIEMSDGILHSFSQFVCGICNESKLKHFSADGVLAVIEHSMRLVDHQQMLSARFGLLVDLVQEAAYIAARGDSEHTGRSHVQAALDARRSRSGQVSDLLQQLLLEGTLKVDLEGAEVGQVNGLAIYSTGDVAFGKPARITTQAYMGSDGFINIEREADLSGKTHDKGVMILAGFLGNRFAQNFPLSVNISLAFEQSYGPVDGDSASSTELYSILSELSAVPIRQDIAVTGSVNQKGEIQSIGGVNEKIEGFFDLCKAAGKLGSAGVLIPQSNERNLMLRPDVVESIRNGEFHIYSAKTVADGIEVLTGVEAGEPDADGNYPPGSVNGLAAARLRRFAEGYRDFTNSPK